MLVSPIIDDALISGNNIIEIFWENIPYGDGTTSFELPEYID